MRLGTTLLTYLCFDIKRDKFLTVSLLRYVLLYVQKTFVKVFSLQIALLYKVLNRSCKLDMLCTYSTEVFSCSIAIF